MHILATIISLAISRSTEGKRQPLYHYLIFHCVTQFSLMVNDQKVKMEFGHIKSKGDNILILNKAVTK